MGALQSIHSDEVKNPTILLDISFIGDASDYSLRARSMQFKVVHSVFKSTKDGVTLCTTLNYIDRALNE